MHDVKKILVVSMSTTTCRKAIHYGVSLAKMTGAELRVFHSVYDPFSLEGWNLPVPSLEAIRESYSASQKKARKELNKFIEQEKTPDMKISLTVTDHPMAREVMRIVKDEKVDLLIMVHFEEGRLEHFLFSGAIHGLVRKMPCSVLLVKEHREWESV